MLRTEMDTDPLDAPYHLALCLLKALEPDVYAKGGDYTIETIVQEERRLVEGYGGRIAIIPGVEGHSTTNIIDRITEEQR